MALLSDHRNQVICEFGGLYGRCQEFMCFIKSDNSWVRLPISHEELQADREQCTGVRLVDELITEVDYCVCAWFEGLSLSEGCSIDCSLVGLEQERLQKLQSHR